MIKKITNFFNVDIWQEPSASRNPLAEIMVRQLRIIIVAIGGFSNDKVQLRASALTLYTLLSIVPILAMALGITKGFGLDQFFQDYLKQTLSQHQDVLNEAILFADNMLSNLKGGFIAGAGFLVLMGSIIKILGDIENSFNHIWRIEKSRDFFRRISNYLSLALIAPVFVVVSSSLKVKLVMDYIENVVLISYLGPVIKIGFWLLSYSLIWFLFILMYLVLTNARIKIRSAVFGGIVAGTIFHFLQWTYFMLQGFFSGYGAVYGSFAALPLFLMWLQYSWLIVLWGAELAYAHQHIEILSDKKNAMEMNYYHQRLLALLVCREVIRNFDNAAKPETAAELAEKVKAPVFPVRECISKLQKAGILSEIVPKNNVEHTFQPALATERISVGFVIDKLDKSGGGPSAIGTGNVSKALSDIIDSFYDTLKTSPGNRLLREL